ncbi:DUF4942 domain-containing protein [Limnoglobus roseus]|nr:DUF4942 domain-containing protein [Limnoglobus roseus]
MLRRLPDVIAEYDEKKAALPDAVAAFEAAGSAVKLAACVGGTWGETSIETGSVYESRLAESLLKSAWRHIYRGLRIDSIASAADKRRFDQAMTTPAPFTLENIRATFGDFLLNPRANILRGLAEVFCDLDQAYKSHDKVKIGVVGLPKRVIISGCSSSCGWGQDKLRDVLNALAAYQRKPLTTYQELTALFKTENALLVEWKATDHQGTEMTYPARGVRLRRFSNGNGHLFFEPDALRDINMALAEYYGDVLADCTEEKPTERRAGTEVSKDLQYYPTPAAVVERVLGDVYIRQGERVLEPSCGCGRFLDALRQAGADAVGVEVDPGRAAMARSKGHRVMLANFLETVPTGDYDHVVMNPPFYGKHYAKHVNHALKFLKPGGKLTAILPVTARYDHGLLDGRWSDLPVGSFSESGTNINTTVLAMWAAA